VIRFLRWVLSQPRADDNVQMKCGPGQPPGPHLLRESHRRQAVCIRARGPLSLKLLSPALPKVALRWRSAPRTQGALTAIALGRLQSRHARPFLRRPQRPGHPQRLHVLGTAPAAILSILLWVGHWGTTQNRVSGKPPQNQPCAITGSVSSTPAVIALSRMARHSSTAKCGPAVRNLWRL